ncbi:malate dehydrogenase, cytoplasmic-like isoform X2 [Phyllopteryx taeniolatus]|nr:malate dehydrogenase, cytoplasmic-like isoform X2 [Phyllopteryx taeniolatus]
MPRREGMERKDLLKANMAIFETQGTALEKYAKKAVKVLVVGNPANTNCLIAMKSAPSIPKENFSCLTRLDHNRARSQVAMRCNVPATHVKNVIIWGDHLSKQYPDVHHCKVNVSGGEVACFDAVKDEAWLKGDFITNKSWKIVEGLPIDDFSKAKMEATATELIDERDTAMEFLAKK